MPRTRITEESLRALLKDIDNLTYRLQKQITRFAIDPSTAHFAADIVTLPARTLLEKLQRLHNENEKERKASTLLEGEGS